MSNLNILICGAGIAGPPCAFFLARIGAQITIVERSPQPRNHGQNIDLRGEGQTVAEIMGLDKIIREHNTTEKGARFVDSDNNILAQFEAGEEGSRGNSFTSDIEILRGELAGIFYEATRHHPNIKYVFGERVDAVRQVDKGVEVDFKYGKLPSGSKFDLLIAADGQNSRTREIIFAGEPGMSRDEVTRHTGVSMAFFTIPRGPTDSEYARAYIATGRRNIFLRPDNHGTTRVIAGVNRGNDETLKNVTALSIPKQKALIKEMFVGAGWETERVMNHIDEAEDFYMQTIAQIKAPRWTKGRATLLGDAGYCPSVLTGMGTTVGLCGAYILAGELSKSPEDVDKALEEYERAFRPVVDGFQTLMPSVLKLIAPETGWGVKVLQTTIWFAVKSGLVGLVQWIGAWKSSDPWRLPDYPALKK